MKTTIYGFIKVKETHDPVPGLIVSVSGEITPLKKPSKTLSGKAPEVPGTISAEKRERISFGSALTGEKGDFQIEIDFHNFSYSKDNVNYQIYLGVYAPWGSQVNTKVGPKLENYLLEQIALHEKSYGEKESFIIQIEADILKKFNIILQKQAPFSVDESVAGYVKKFKEQKEFQDKLRKELLPFRKANFEKRKKITEDARKFAKGLTAIPKEIRLSTSSNFAEKASDVKPKMREAMKRNLNKWAEQSKTASGRKNMIALTDKGWEMAGMAVGHGLLRDFTESTLNSSEVCKILSIVS